MTAEFFGLSEPVYADADAELLAALKGVFYRDWDNHPRSLQKRLGPSEVGHPCARKLAAGMAGLERLNPDGDPLPAWLGTAGHAKYEQAVIADNERIIAEHQADPTVRCTYDGDKAIGRWFPERRVQVSEYLSGTCDLMDTWTNTVTDLKFPGASRATYYSKNGPSREYQTQAHLYGRGYKNAGWPVERVSIWFLPRGGYLSKSFIWSEPYNDDLVDEALAKLDRVTTLVTDLDLANHPERLSLVPHTPNGCMWCPMWSPTGTEPHSCKDGAL